MGGDDHRCEWRDRAESLQVQLDHANATITTLTQKLTAVESTLEKLQRHVFGQRSEKMPPVAEVIRDPARAEAARISALQKRRENAEKRRQPRHAPHRAQGARGAEGLPKMRRP
jgi:transposase